MERTHSSTDSSGLSRWRVALVVSIAVALSLTVAVVAFKCFTGPRWHIQVALRSEARAMEAGDRATFMSLQNPADQAWCRHQRDRFDSRIWAKERGESWAMEPLPRPRVVKVELQGERAWAEVKRKQGDTTQRRVEFFCLVDDQWKHTGPDEQYWGDLQETRTEHLHWLYRERDGEWVTNLLDRGEELYQRICDDFGLDSAQQEVTIEVVYSLDSAYLPLYPEGPILPMPSPLLVGYDDEMVESFLGSLLLNYLGVRATGRNSSTMTEAHRTVLDAITRWEATQVLSGEWRSYQVPELAKAIEAGELLSLQELWGNGTTQQYALTTAQSLTLIDYIVEKYGRRSISTLLKALGKSPSVEGALQEALGPGFIIEEFEAHWLTFIWERYGPPGTVPVITPAPRRSPTPASTATPALTLPAAPLPLPAVEGIEAYQSTMRPGSEGEVAFIEGLPHYDLALQADFETETLSGRERLVFVNREHEALKDILLRLYPNCSQAGTMIVGRVSNDGQAVDFTYQAGDTAVLVSLPQPLSVGQSIALEVDFAVRLHPQAEDVWSAAFFYPMLAVYQDGAWRKDAISSGPDAVFSESASYAVELTVHDTVMVAASGVKVNAVDNSDGTTTHTYHGGPLRGFTLFMSENFQESSETVDGIVVNTWYLPGDKENGEDILEHAADAVEVFDKRFGPYPYAELDVVVILDTRLPADMVTGVEYPTLVAVLHGGAGDPEFATVHEVAHQWWYGVVGNDVLQEPWLDESFANYSVVVYYEDIHGQDMAHEVYQGRMLALYEHVRDANQDGPVGRSIQDFSESQQPSGPIIYGKGAVFLDTLRQEVGDEAFFAILQERYRRHKYGIATGGDLLADAEEVAGRELDDLFSFWIGR